jgi:transcriptional regulator with XRE-family HTH domain
MSHTELQALRKGAKVSRFELADRLRVNYATIQRTEEGRREITEDFAARWQQALVEITGERHQVVLAGAA